MEDSGLCRELFQSSCGTAHSAIAVLVKLPVLAPGVEACSPQLYGLACCCELMAPTVLLLCSPFSEKGRNRSHISVNTLPPRLFTSIRCHALPLVLSVQVGRVVRPFYMKKLRFAMLSMFLNLVGFIPPPPSNFLTLFLTFSQFFISSFSPDGQGGETEAGLHVPFLPLLLSQAAFNPHDSVCLLEPT